MIGLSLCAVSIASHSSEVNKNDVKNTVGKDAQKLSCKRFSSMSRAMSTIFIKVSNKQMEQASNLKIIFFYEIISLCYMNIFGRVIELKAGELS